MKKIWLSAVLAFFLAGSLFGQQEAGSPEWGFTFRVPTGWVFQQSAEAVMLGHNTIPGLILVFPHLASDMNEVRAELQKGIVDENLQLSLAGELEALDANIVVGEFTGTLDFQQVQAQCIGTLNPGGGGGAFIIALTTPQEYGRGLADPAVGIAKAMRYTKTDASELVGHFAGKWAAYTGSTLINVTLAPNGEYLYEDESSYSGNLTDGTYDTGSWGAIGQNRESARWTVRGTRERGTLIISYPDGSKEYVSYQVFVERGQTYWNEYLFDGVHYQKQ